MAQLGPINPEDFFGTAVGQPFPEMDQMPVGARPDFQPQPDVMPPVQMTPAVMPPQAAGPVDPYAITPERRAQLNAAAQARTGAPQGSNLVMRPLAERQAEINAAGGGVNLMPGGGATGSNLVMRPLAERQAQINAAGGGVNLMPGGGATGSDLIQRPLQQRQAEINAAQGGPNRYNGSALQQRPLQQRQAQINAAGGGMNLLPGGRATGSDLRSPRPQRPQPRPQSGGGFASMIPSLFNAFR